MINIGKMSDQKKAFALHHSSVVVDAHCDTLTHMLDTGRKLGELSTSGHLDLPRMKAGGIDVQFFAVFVHPSTKKYLRRAMELIDFFYQQIEDNKDEIKMVTGASEIDLALNSGKKAAILSVEGGHVLEGSIGVLRILYRLGVRCLTLTWNGRNEIADGVAERGTGGGLTEFGKRVVREMNKLGMLVDVSHLSGAGFKDVLTISEAPIIASHSNCCSVYEHPRNLTDEQIVALANKDGVIGINFYPEFIGKGEASLDAIIDHIDHIISLVGSDHLGLGSDFDGIDKTPADLDDASKIPNLTNSLLKRGYKEEDIRKILGKNFLRVIKEVLG